MKRWIALAAALVLGVCALYPDAGFTEDRDTVALARAIYALGRQEGYEAKLALATVVMNRVENPWFASTLSGVLSEQHQFPSGSRYDDASLAAAHAVLAGQRALPKEAVYYQSLSATRPRQDAPLRTVGGYAFYDTQARA